MWTDPEDVDTSVWNGTVVVRKEGSVPTDKSDGTIVKALTWHEEKFDYDANDLASHLYYDSGVITDSDDIERIVERIQEMEEEEAKACSSYRHHNLSTLYIKDF